MVYKFTLEKTDIEVLAFLIKNNDREYSIKEIAEKLKKTYVKAHNSVRRLSNNKVLQVKVMGKSHYCSIDFKNNLDIVCFVNSLMAKSFLDKHKKIKIIISNIQESIKLPDYMLLIFGSYAKGDESKTSDLDIAVMTSKENKEKIERAINSMKRLASLELHSLEFTYDEFIGMLKAKDNNVGKEIIKNSIIFSGCEQYYNCLELSR